MGTIFKNLRYPEDAFHANCKISALVDAGIGKRSAIYKYESGESKPGYEAIKAYKKFFNCSYEYLFGEAIMKNEDYKYITDDSLLGKLNENTIDGLTKLLTDESVSTFNIDMFNAFFTEPLALQRTLNTLFRFMYQLNLIYTNPTLNYAEKELKASSLWFSLNSVIDSYLKESLMPHLQAEYKKFEIAEEERDRKEIASTMEQYERYLKQRNQPIREVRNLVITEAENKA